MVSRAVRKHVKQIEFSQLGKQKVAYCSSTPTAPVFLIHIFDEPKISFIAAYSITNNANFAHTTYFDKKFQKFPILFHL